MIKRLRRKFILINLSTLAIALVIVMSAVLSATAARQNADARDALMDALHKMDQGLGPGRPRIEAKTRHNENMAFSVLLDSKGNLLAAFTDSVEIDETVLMDAARQALAQGNEGVVAAYELRYMVRRMRDVTLIAFLSRTGDAATLRLMALTLGLGCAAGLTAFYFISRRLARWALRPVQEAWTAQKQFISDASHELKTPLTVILANLNLIRAHADSPVRQSVKWLDSTEAEAGRMRALVEQMLFLARADEARAQYARERFSLSDAAWKCALSFEPVAFERGLSIRADIEDGVYLTGDEPRLSQVMNALLDNACKYALAGTAVTVSLKSSQDGAVFFVHNMGESLASEQLERVFERFYRADASRVRENGGYGLGLSIAQVIAQGHGGCIKAENAKEGGVTFIMTLPSDRPPYSVKRIRDHSSSSSSSGSSAL